MRPRITAVTLSVPEVSVSVDFYRRAFGWEPAFAIDEVAFFDMGGMVQPLVRTGGGAEKGITFTGGDVLAHNVESAEEVDRIFEKALEEGATVAAPARRQDWGGYSGILADPDGHLWEIAHNPDWPLDEDGRPTLPY